LLWIESYEFPEDAVPSMEDLILRMLGLARLAGSSGETGWIWRSVTSPGSVVVTVTAAHPPAPGASVPAGAIGGALEYELSVHELLFPQP
jgi:hypothetical protein